MSSRGRQLHLLKKSRTSEIDDKILIGCLSGMTPLISRLYTCLSVFIQSSQSHLLPHVNSLSSIISQGTPIIVTLMPCWIIAILSGLHASSPNMILLPVLSSLRNLVQNCGLLCLDTVVVPTLPILIDMIRWEPKRVGADVEFKMTSNKKKKKSLPSLYVLCEEK